MSLSEIFNHGTPHPWANLRPNNVTVDGTLLASNITNQPLIPSLPISINVGTLTTPFYQKFSGTVTSNATTLPIATNLIINFQLGVNTCTYVRYILNGITQAAGGTHPNAFPYQSADYQINYLGGVITFHGGNPRNPDNAILTDVFAANTAGQKCVSGAGLVTFSAYDTNAGDIVKWIYSFEIWSINQ